jgi:hypothetical protein
MPVITPAFVTLNPSYTLPEVLLPYSQASGAFHVLPGSDVMVRLGEGDLAAYINRADIRTKAGAGQDAFNQLPSVGIFLSYIQTATYLMRVRAEWDHHDQAAMARRGMSIDQAYRLGMRQSHFQLGRSALLFGMNPANGEGLLNTAGATAINLPPDSQGNFTASTYDNGEMAFFIISQILAIKTRTNNLGIGRKFTVLGPQRTLGLFEYNVVQLTQYQRAGAGSQSTAGVVEGVGGLNGDEITWAYDDTLIGKGAGGTDAILIVMPEVENPQPSTPWNTNDFATIAPGLMACTMQLADMIAPRELTAPLAAGAVDVVSEMRLTSGWGLRGEAITIVSMQFS